MRLLFRTLALLPLPALHGLGAFAGWLLWWIPNGRRRAALTNIERCFPELDARRRRLRARRALVHEMKAYFEIPFFWMGPKDKLLGCVVRCEGEALVEQGLARGKGVILLGLHFGGFEPPGHDYASKRTITGIYKPMGGALEDMGLKGRARTGATLIPIQGGGMRALARDILARNETFYYMPDQDPPRGRGVFAPFFGIPAHTPTLVTKLAHETGATVLLVTGERLPWGRGYVSHYRAVPDTVGQADVEAGCAVLNAAIEAAIREKPEQYWWGYKRFRRRPPGEPPFYD